MVANKQAEGKKVGEVAGMVVNPHKASLTNPGNFFRRQGSKVDLPPPGNGTVSWELGFMALAAIFPKIPQKLSILF
jgi:hypothetical protein